MSDIRPIGVYDSGVGGLTVVSELEMQLPHERIIYFADNERSPYGEKTPEEILQFSREIIDFLLQRDVKMVVAACNTSSALAIPYLQDSYDIPIVGLIKSGVHAAVHASTKKVVGLWATRATVESGAYFTEMKQQAPGVETVSVACPRLVPIVEGSDPVSERELVRILQEYAIPIIASGADTLILGCTHYPFLSEKITKVAPDLKLVDPAREAVRVAASILKERGLLNANGGKTAGLVDNGIHGRLFETDESATFGELERHMYYVSGDPEQFRVRAKILTGKNLPIQRWTWGKTGPSMLTSD